MCVAVCPPLVPSTCSAPQPGAKPVTVADMHPASQLRQTQQLLLRNSRWAAGGRLGTCWQGWGGRPAGCIFWRHAPLVSQTARAPRHDTVFDQPFSLPRPCRELLRNMHYNPIRSVVAVACAIIFATLFRNQGQETETTNGEQGRLLGASLPRGKGLAQKQDHSFWEQGHGQAARGQTGVHGAVPIVAAGVYMPRPAPSSPTPGILNIAGAMYASSIFVGAEGQPPRAGSGCVARARAPATSPQPALLSMPALQARFHQPACSSGCALL